MHSGVLNRLGNAGSIKGKSMQVSIETTQGLERKMTIEVPAEEISSAVSERLQSIKKTARLKGFRPGKVPMKVVQKRFGPQVRLEVLGDVINSSFRDAVVQEQLRPAGSPQFEPLSDPEEKQPDLPFTYTATFEVYPEFEPKFNDSIKIESKQADVEESDIDEMLDNLLKQRTEYQSVERQAGDDDQVVIDFTGSVDGEEFDGGKAEKAPLVLGSGAMIPGFEDQLLGVNGGEEKTIEVKFPDDYHASELAGKTADFRIKVHEVKEPVTPELDEEMVKSFGIEDGNVDTLRADIRKNMERELQQRKEADVKQQVMDGLLALNEIDVPNALLQDEIGRMREQMMQQMPEGSETHLSDELFSDEADKRVRLGLVVGEIVRAKEIRAEPAAVREEVETIASTYQEPQHVIDYYYGNPEMLKNVEGLVLEKAVTDSILEVASVNEIRSTFKEIMNPTPAVAEAGEEVAEEGSDN